jgi:hypothetical protein
MEETVVSFVLFRKDVNFLIRHVLFQFLLSTRLRNLLWYVCSRGPLRPIFLTALLHVPFPSTDDLPHRALHPRLLEPRCLVVACPLGTRVSMRWRPSPWHVSVAVVKAARNCQACVCCDRTGNMWTCSRSFATPVDHLYTKLTGPCSLDVSIFRPDLRLLLGEDGMGCVADW